MASGGDARIKHLAWLARVTVGEDEAAELEKEIEALKQLVDKILEAKVDNLQPLYHPLDLVGRLREDNPAESPGRTCVELNAETEQGYVKAPRTVED